MTAQELKNSILQLAIQGKLVKQDPNDEPASVLLEKIKEEREKLIKEKKIKREKYSEIYKDSSDNHYYEKFEDGTINDISEEIPFDIPDSWKWVRFNNLVNYQIGKTPPRGEKTFWNNDYNWVSISDMNDGSIILETKEKVSKKSFDNIFNGNISTKETLLMSFKLTIGKVSILDIDAFHNEAIISIYPYYDINFILRNYLFKILPLVSNYGNSKNAIKGKTLNSKSINNLLIPIMNYNEMQKIYTKINRLEPLIYEYSEKYKKLDILNSNYKDALKKSILQYAIQGKLVKQDFNDEPAEVLINKILDEKRELIKTKQIKKENLSVIYKGSDNQFYEKFDDGTEVNITDEIPFDIPNSWSWVRLNNLTCKEIKRGKSPKYVNKSDIFVFAQKCNQKDGIISLEKAKYLNEELLKKYDVSDFIMKNDIVINSTGNGTLGRVGYIIDEAIVKNKVVVDSHVTLIRLNNQIDSLYVYYYLKFCQKYLESKATGSTNQTELSPEIIKNILVPIPNKKEQLIVSTKLRKIFNYIETAE